MEQMNTFIALHELASKYLCVCVCVCVCACVCVPVCVCGCLQVHHSIITQSKDASLYEQGEILH